MVIHYPLIRTYDDPSRKNSGTQRPTKPPPAPQPMPEKMTMYEIKKMRTQIESLYENQNIMTDNMNLMYEKIEKIRN